MLRFTKMHGLGNDYVYISTFDQHVDAPEQLARRISDRHRGVGADGLILVAPPEAPDAHVRMIMFNADGSRAEMCGNGIRCLAKLAWERGLARHNPLRVQTDRGVLTLDLNVDPAGRVREVRVDMGAPVLDPARIPVNLPGGMVVNVPFPLILMRGANAREAGAAAGTAGAAAGAVHAAGPSEDAELAPPRRTPVTAAPVNLHLTAVSMGNPHAIFFVDDVAAVPLADWGPRIERHELFPARTNVHFVQVLAPDRVRMITWERGAGATQACGTGASAVGVAGVLNALTQPVITAELPGGELRIEWDPRTKHVYKTGPAEEVFTGEWPE
ncbi:MAG: diaminopimelate epimerase [Planctomycetota bacterium]